MKVIVIADLQMMLEPFKIIRDEIIAADLVLLVGNLTNQGTWIEAKKLFNVLDNFNKNIFSVMGSLDDMSVEGYLSSQNISLHGHGIVVENVGIYGLGGGNTTLFQRKIEFNEKQITHFLEKGQKTIRDCEFVILISHTPPYNSKLDKTIQGHHVGSRAIRSFIFRHPPDIFISSSTQNKAQTDILGATSLVSPAPFKTGDYILIDTSLDKNPIQVKNAYNQVRESLKLNNGISF